MEIISTYQVKIKHYNHIFRDTVNLYRDMVDYLIGVCMENREDLKSITNDDLKVVFIESLTHKTKVHPYVPYNFDRKFYKVPSGLRREAIRKAIELVVDYSQKKGKPIAGRIYPKLLNKDMYVQLDRYKAKIKVYTRNIWDWLIVDQRKSDVDYLNRHCRHCEIDYPVLYNRGKEWLLKFTCKEDVTLSYKPVFEQTIVAVDLGMNNACVCSVMRSDGTILGRHFLKLHKEKDRLKRSYNRLVRARIKGATKLGRFWNIVNGINREISIKTANYITDLGKQYSADVIVIEDLDVTTYGRNSYVNLWLTQCEDMAKRIEHKAHKAGMRFATVSPKYTSRLAFDGSGDVERNIDGNYSLCRFPNGKVYNSDLSASYNIGARSSFNLLEMHPYIVGFWHGLL